LIFKILLKGLTLAVDSRVLDTFEEIFNTSLMKNLLPLLLLVSSINTYSQERVNPVIKNFGGIYDIPEATVKPDSSVAYKIVIDVVGGSEDPNEIDASLNNVARMLNLYAVGGADFEKINVVLAIHGKSTYSTMNDNSYKAKFGVKNPNTPLIEELKEAGVKITVCGQSLKGRNVSTDQLLPEIEVATSMLTTVTTYQMKGYALLKF
jgi:intracellular sulfur oxidation DsrE/DsrF family protein